MLHSIGVVGINNLTEGLAMRGTFLDNRYDTVVIICRDNTVCWQESAGPGGMMVWYTAPQQLRGYQGVDWDASQEDSITNDLAYPESI